ncbi:MAG: hypothetical protein M1275_02545 [Patescibacteria group bacterium]|nr:hypothetical protein [Patescibacteria group bacterium]
MSTKITPIFRGRVSRGRLVLENPDSYKRYLFTVEGDINLTVRKKGKPRSTDENSYYWGVVVQLISDELGINPDEVHEAIKWKFLRRDAFVKIKNAEVPFSMTRSTTSLSTSEFEDLMTKVRTWAAAELNIHIPLPNEVEYGEWR